MYMAMAILIKLLFLLPSVSEAAQYDIMMFQVQVGPQSKRTASGMNLSQCSLAQTIRGKEAREIF